MSEIRCLSPNIILNKSWHVNKVDFTKGWRIIIRGQEMNYVPLPKRAKLQKEEVDECYYYNIYTGEMIPCYLVVPCQKCILCKDKKAVDWATRVTCEGNYHVNCPWWITLTYNCLSLPDDGLIKRDVQNFFKRLRERLSRIIGADVRIRFVCVGEYGGNTARAHYHAIIYGLPLLTAKEILRIIENAWAKRISFLSYCNIIREFGDKLGHDYTFIRPDKNGDNLYYQRLGFAYVKPAHDSTPLYLAKYMFKPEINTPEGKNPNFYLASRKNGIGYEYVVEFCKYHRQNPDVTKLDFLNKHTGKICHFTIPQYFKNYWFPTPSRLVPNEVRKSWLNLSLCVEELNTYKKYLLEHGFDAMIDDVSSMLSDLNKKYPFWRSLSDKYYSDFDVYKEWIRECTYKVETEGYYYIDLFGFGKAVPNFKEESTMTSIEYCRKKLVETYSTILMEYEFIMSLKFDVSEFMQCLTLRDKHKGAMTQKMLNKPLVSPIDAAYKLKKRYELAKHKQYN